MKYKKSVYKTLAMITQLGISVIAPILVCVALGYWLDQKFDLKLTVLCIVLGILAGIRNAYALIKQAVQDSEGKEREKR